MDKSLKIEQFLDWSEALDYKIDIHVELIGTRDIVKRHQLINLYKKAERVCDRLAQKLCAQE